jgi:SAM-dependent methyltransferase
MANYKTLQAHYEKRLAEHGANAKGMDWPNQEDLNKRFEVLMSIAPAPGMYSLLDLGCGIGLLIDYLKEQQRFEGIAYLGSDISPRMIDVARDMHPAYSFEVRDTLVTPYEEGQFDYIIMNGVLTEKQEMSQAQMVDFAKQIILKTFTSCSKGISFNVMSSHVDWKRDDLFHWELDEVVAFLVKNCSRKIKIMMDYGLYEYTVHLKK